jgi:hypothetical protein
VTTGVALWPDEETSTFGALYDAAASSGGDLKAHTEWQHDPIGWAVAKLGIERSTLVWSESSEKYLKHVWDGTQDPLVAIATALADWQDVAVESATGTGKSYFAGAVILLWFLACWEGSAVFTFAPKEDQLRLYIWMELRKVWPRFKLHFPTAVLNDLELLIRGSGQRDWGAWGYAVGVKAGEESATAAQGMHRPHMMLIYEETPGIKMPVIKAGENTCTAPHNIRLFLGNPDNQQDALHQVSLEPDVTAIRISGLDHPNVVTGKEVLSRARSRGSRSSAARRSTAPITGCSSLELAGSRRPNRRPRSSSRSTSALARRSTRILASVPVRRPGASIAPTAKMATSQRSPAGSGPACSR